MGCPKNPVPGFLFGTTEGPHDLELRVSYWAFEKFEYVSVCRRCGSRHYDFGVEFDGMVRLGIDPEFLLAIRFSRQGTAMTQAEWEAERAEERP